jgi:uncharacterized protein (TIGR02145 family)
MKQLHILLFAIVTVIACEKDNDDKNTVTDYDGNVYHSVQIGTQVWMVENLKTTHYNDGSAIPLITNNSAWQNLTTDGYCWYNNDEGTNKDTYGALYNWVALNTGKLCPSGWHVPTDDDWMILANYLGGLQYAGGKLKETGTSHWNSPNTDATNQTFFTALPGGFRAGTGGFAFMGEIAYWWSSTEYIINNTEAWYYLIHYDQGIMEKWQADKSVVGFSIRCIKD